ncbi:cadherin-like domain-containing protein [Chryseobacterium sp. 09-1422]|uniref:Cadherin-like domain-containing protein n=1 Tax=Chryseobacterium kimseyorum TaxID=2984028 RepID=A0ABT3HY29_9FLAO|nr:cadherin-like domain-containing protein [Chryseobacterium kimseyorum]MCW3168669.1 cadherin-like domain-containing protein [Chryseobacterium kimseyorum]
MSTYNNQTATTVFNSGNVSLNGSVMGFSFLANAGQSNANRIGNDHNSSEYGIYISHPNNSATTYATSIRCAITFTAPAGGLKFIVNDIDNNDYVRIRVFDENGLSIPLVQNSNFTFMAGGSTVVEYNASLQEFYDDDNQASDDNSRNGSVSFNFSGKKVSKIEFDYYDTNNTGAITFARFEVPCIVANNDSYSVTGGLTSTTSSVLSNDIYNGAQATTSNVTVSPVGTLPAGFAFSAAGVITISNTVLPGVYSIPYQICQLGQSANCTVAVATITILLDSDGDTVPDYLDLDDDNDGILDSAECGGGAIYNYSGFGLRTVGTTANLIGFTDTTYTPTTLATNIIAGADANHLASDASRNRLLFANSGGQGSLFAYQFSTNTVVNIGSGFLSSLGDSSGGAGMYNNDYYIYDDTGTTTEGLWRVTFNSAGIASTLTKVANPPSAGPDLGDMAISHSGMAYITSNGNLHRIDLSTLNLSTTAPASAWTVVNTNSPISGSQLFFAANGDLIGSSSNGNLVRVNPSTGANLGTVSTLTNGYTWGDLSEAPTVGFNCGIDTDGDGIPNNLDLDSDGDGCPDSTEGAGNFSPTTSASGSIASQTPNTNFGTAVNTTTGIPTLVGAGQAVGQSQDSSRNDCLDSDGDTIPDWQDLDDDNDGITDCVENGLGAGATVSTIFELNGNAVAIGNTEVQLTAAIASQAGQMWSYEKVDFSKSFTLNYETNLGNINANGADGIAAVFHNSPLGVNAVGINGVGMGARGIANGIVLEIDTYNNSPDNVGDIANDHGQIWVSSNQSGAGLLTAAADLGELEDGTWKAVVINWNFQTKTLSYTVGGINAGTYTFPTTNPITSYFGGASKVFFGYTASTGGFVNDQRIRFANLCSLPIEADADGDGIPNHLDLDSDNDGCPDSREGAGDFNPSTPASGPIAAQTPNTNFGTAVNTTTGIPNLVGAGQGVGQSQSFSQNDCLDTDGDTIPDWQDLDDDNDGILDTVECSNTITDLGNALTAGTAKDILPSDFGLALNAKNQNVTADLSAKFGYPANSGAVVVSITNASVNPTANAWWTKQGQQPSVWRVTGTMSAFVLMAQDVQYYGNDSKTIHIYDSAAVIPITFPGLVNQAAVANQWAVSDSPTQKTLTDLDTNLTTIENGNWRFANMNFGPKTFGFSTTTATADPAYAVLMYLECDADGDGIPNRLDLDSDNDGCPDAIEGAENVTRSQLNPNGSINIGLVAPNNGVGSLATDLGVPRLVNSGGSADTGTATVNTVGQPVGTSQNASINSCFVEAQNDINQTPVGVSSSGSVLTNDKALDGTAVTVTSATYLNSAGVATPLTLGTSTTVYDAAGVVAGTVTLNSNGTYTFIPAANYTGTVPVTYTISNTSGSTASATLSIEVGAVVLAPGNNKPIAQNDTGTAESGSDLSSNVLLNDSDPDANPLVVTTASVALGTPTQVSGLDINGNTVANAGTLTLNANGTYTFSPAPTFTGTVNPVTYTACDNGTPALCDTASLSIKVVPNSGNNTFANDDAKAVPKGAAITITAANGVLANDSDPEGNTQTVTTVNGVAINATGTTNVTVPNGTLVFSANGSYTFTPNATFVGTVVLPYTVCDNVTPQACDTATLYLTFLDTAATVCYEDPALVAGATYPVRHGVTLLGRAGSNNGNWPMLRNSAYTALESKTKGFVVTRNSSPETTIAIPVVGMMVFDTDENAGAGCLKIYTGPAAGEGWKCFSTQGCP